MRLLSLGPTHTRGDTIVWVEGDRILFAGDVVMNRTFVAFASPYSSVKAWLADFDQLEPLHPVKVVPSHGPVGDASLIAEQRTMMKAIQSRAVELKRQGKSADETAADGPERVPGEATRTGRRRRASAASPERRTRRRRERAPAASRLGRCAPWRSSPRWRCATAAVTRLASADGQFWDIQDTSPWSQDSGGIATGGRANPFNGFGYLKIRVRAGGGATLVPHQYLTGFGLAHDGGERFDSITPVLHGDVLVARGALRAEGRRLPALRRQLHEHGRATTA